MEAHLAERPPAAPGSATGRFSSSNSSQGTPSGVQWICPMKLKKSVRGAPATDDGQAISRRAGEGDGRGQPGGGVKGPEREGERGAMGTGVRGMLRWAVVDASVPAGQKPRPQHAAGSRTRRSCQGAGRCRLLGVARRSDGVGGSAGRRWGLRIDRRVGEHGPSNCDHRRPQACVGSEDPVVAMSMDVGRRHEAGRAIRRRWGGGTCGHRARAHRAEMFQLGRHPPAWIHLNCPSPTPNHRAAAPPPPATLRAPAPHSPAPPPPRRTSH